MGTVKQLILKAFNQAEFVKITELPGASPPGPAGGLTAPPDPRLLFCPHPMTTSSAVVVFIRSLNENDCIYSVSNMAMKYSIYCSCIMMKDLFISLLRVTVTFNVLLLKSILESFLFKRRMLHDTVMIHS